MIVGIDIKSAALDRTIARLAGVDLTKFQNAKELVRDGGLLHGIIVEDNRRGVMAGRDKNDRPAPPLRYRHASAIQSAPRRGGWYGTQSPGAVGRLKGIAPAAGRVLPNNNLPSGVYRTLTGPRLAPRRDSSRVIANLRYRDAKLVGGAWVVTCYWKEVLDAKGRELLPRHFNGTGRTPAYDLRGVRPRGLKMALNVVRGHLLAILKRVTP